MKHTEVVWGKPTPPQPRGVVIPEDKLRSLIQLVHPDKHGGSALSAMMFGYLIEKRKELDKPTAKR